MKWLLIRLVLLTALACALGAGFAQRYRLPWVPSQDTLNAEEQHRRDKARIHDPNAAQEIAQEALISLPRFRELAAAGALVVDARESAADFEAAHLAAPFIVHLRSQDAPAQAGNFADLAQADVPILLYCESNTCPESRIAYHYLRGAFPQVGRFFVYLDGWEGLRQASVMTTPGAPPDLRTTADACLNHVIDAGAPAEFAPRPDDPPPPGTAASAPSGAAPVDSAPPGERSAWATARGIAALSAPWLLAATALVLLLSGQRRVAAWGGRLVVGGLFLLAAGLKIRDPMQFASDIRSYLVFPPLATNAMALLIPWLEATAAGALIIGLWRREARVIVAVLLVAFTGLKAAVLASGRTIDCGCYGANNVLATMEVGWRGVGFNGALLVMLAAEALASWRLGRKVVVPPPAGDADTRSASVPHA